LYRPSTAIDGRFNPPWKITLYLPVALVVDQRWNLSLQAEPGAVHRNASMTSTSCGYSSEVEVAAATAAEVVAAVVAAAAAATVAAAGSGSAAAA
jgi:hypothetical protein